MKYKFKKVKPYLIEFTIMGCGSLSNKNYDHSIEDCSECMFESCDDPEIDDKQESGICWIDDCPFGYSASLESMVEIDPTIADYWINFLKDKKNKNPVDYGSRWFVVCRELLKLDESEIQYYELTEA